MSETTQRRRAKTFEVYSFDRWADLKKGAAPSRNANIVSAPDLAAAARQVREFMAHPEEKTIDVWSATRPKRHGVRRIGLVARWRREGESWIYERGTGELLSILAVEPQ